ncbi:MULTISPECIES: hypothetical protein [Hafnia]|jgi:uncharacterized protein YacL|uniref:Transmembrane protein n=1 Tax=Hafnia paralvei TaxID=546367 RepID=A0A2A2M7X4_9GAMM|nr:hypothetical protein [Hafnia paralvei]AMH19212.1 hypothetical protein AL518_15045 [Hafnia paralvei]KHS47528.1 hypothetical protein RN38_09600 [Hafnia paralvei]MCK2181805.1 hypothetical protein [Hafnia paralvei]PAV94650.1 hypothetical protein CJD50_19300 [Hafnia paralvei]TBL56250.1 hypothetical protein EYZ00_01500 [Hafnia paralvei]
MVNNEKIWLTVAVVFNAMGLFSGVVALLSGIGGCMQCGDIPMAAGVLFLVLALLSALYSVHLAMQKGRGVMMILGVLATLVACTPLLWLFWQFALRF